VSKLIPILVLGATLGCRAHDPYQSVAATADTGRCEDAARKVAAVDLDEPDMLSSAARTGKTVVSYALTGLGYTSDVVVTVTGGIAASVVICSPVLALEIGMKSNGDLSVHCFENVAPKAADMVNPELGPKAKASTAEWREDLDYTPLSRAMRQVARCYEQRGDAASLAKAYVQLQQIGKGPIYPHATPEERALVDKATLELDEKIASKKEARAFADRLGAETQSAAAAETPQPILWIDVKSGLSWRLYAVPVATAARAKEICANTWADGTPWRLPAQLEVANAIEHGLADAKRNEPAAALIAARVTVFGEDGEGHDQLLDFVRGETTAADEQGAAALLCVR
jgi:hypothetical protein